MHFIGRFVAILFSLSALAAQPAAAASSASLVSLEQQLSYLVAGKSADVGIAALDLNSGETVSIKGSTPFPMASTLKVADTALYLAQVDHGRRSLDDTINGQPVRSLMRRMLIHSDNVATDIILKDLGGPRALHDWLSDNGITGLRVDRTIAQLLSAKRDLWDYRDSSTPTAMVDLLRRIYKAELIKPSSRNYLLDLMSQCETGKNRMKALLPSGTPVEHKTERSLVSPTTSASSPCLTAVASPSRSSRVVARIVRARSPKPPARSTTASSRHSPGRSAPRSPRNKCFCTSSHAGRSDALRRPSSLSASEADRLADQA